MAHRSSGRRADLRWSLGAATFNALTAGTNSSTIVTSGITSQTIMRVRGSLLAYLDATHAPGQAVRIGVGFILAQGGAGTTVLSSPLTDGDAPWFWYETFSLGYEEMVTDVVDVPGATAYRATIDSKAMRVLRPDQEVQCVVENQTIQTASAVNVFVDARFLIAD